MGTVDWTFGARRAAQLFVEKWLKINPLVANQWASENYTKEEQEQLVQYCKAEFLKHGLIIKEPTPPTDKEPA